MIQSREKNPFIRTLRHSINSIQTSHAFAINKAYQKLQHGAAPRITGGKIQNWRHKTTGATMDGIHVRVKRAYIGQQRSNRRNRYHSFKAQF